MKMNLLIKLSYQSEFVLRTNAGLPSLTYSFEQPGSNMMLSESKIDNRKGKSSGGRQKLMHIIDKPRYPPLSRARSCFTPRRVGGGTRVHFPSSGYLVPLIEPKGRFVKKLAGHRSSQ